MTKKTKNPDIKVGCGRISRLPDGFGIACGEKVEDTFYLCEECDKSKSGDSKSFVKLPIENPDINLDELKDKLDEMVRYGMLQFDKKKGYKNAKQVEPFFKLGIQSVASDLIQNARKQTAEEIKKLFNDGSSYHGVLIKTMIDRSLGGLK